MQVHDAEDNQSVLAHLHELDEAERHTREHSTCSNCGNFMIPPEGQSFGWCRAAEDYVHELDEYPADCASFDALESR